MGQLVRNEVPGFLVLPVTFLEVSLNGSCVHIKALCCHSIKVSVLAQHFLAWSNKWNLVDPPCTWFGVNCNADTVESIVLVANNLVGTLPDLILPDMTFL